MSYCGIDVSDEAVRRSRSRICREPRLRHVSLKLSAAHELDTIERDRFDCVILNEVVQHFPDIGYLLQVLKNAARIVSPRGVVFLGEFET